MLNAARTRPKIPVNGNKIDTHRANTPCTRACNGNRACKFSMRAKTPCKFDCFVCIANLFEMRMSARSRGAHRRFTVAESCTVLFLPRVKKFFHRVLVNALVEAGFDQNRANRLQVIRLREDYTWCREQFGRDQSDQIEHARATCLAARSRANDATTRQLKARACSSAACSPLAGSPCRRRTS